jgi:hypothetical protein
VSSPTAIAGVTAAIRDLLNDGLGDIDFSAIGSVSVTAQPPDRVVTGQNETNQLNLFLHRVTPNVGWRNWDLPSQDRRGARVGDNPLAIDLHYLLTAYGSDDLNAEVLLGYAMHLLHESPVLTREQLRLLLNGGNPPFGNLPAADLADQVELVKIAPEFLNTEEMSKVWTSTLAHYRPSMGYMASVVLIQSREGLRVAPPVLRQGPEDRGPVAVAAPFPTLTGLVNAASDQLPALRLGDDLVLSGSNLTGTGETAALFEHTKFGPALSLATAPAPGGEGRLSVHLPSAGDDPAAMNQWAIGIYNARVRVTRPGTPAWTTNTVPMALSPTITVTPTAAPAGDVSLTVTCTPRLRPEQEAQTTLIFGTLTVAASSMDTPATETDPTTLSFTIPSVAPGSYQVRLRVEGAFDSLPVLVAGFPPQLSFDPAQTIEIGP